MPIRQHKYVQVISILLNLFVEHDTGDCSDVKIISRDSWGARRPVKTSTIHSPVPNFFIHHTAWKACTSFSECISEMKKVQDLHMDDVDHSKSFNQSANLG